MHTKITIAQSPSQCEDARVRQSVVVHAHAFTPLLESIVVLTLAFVAFLPRLLLALQLDMVTDEVVYIISGKIYLPLLAHAKIGASQWNYNYEHPPLVKLLIGTTIFSNTALGHPLSELVAGRLPSIFMGTLLIVAVYLLGRAPFGRSVALTTALCLAMSPWLVYFSALAYLDMTMTALVTIACLLTWHALHRPWLFIVIALFLALGTASKYTATLAIPGIMLFTAYYFFIIRLYMPVTQRPHIPWLWWLASILLAPIAFFIADPAIWPRPIDLLTRSLIFEWNHSVTGHLTFLAGHYNLHAPHWTILYIVFAKMSAFVTVPATFFAVYGLIQLVRFHRKKVSATEITATAFLFFWLLSLVSMFSLLNIVVGTHYHLPIAVPVALAATTGLASILRTLYRELTTPRAVMVVATPALLSTLPRSPAPLYPFITIALLFFVLVMPHLIGLTTTYGAEGYTSEFFQGEDSTLQVAYPGYREAVQWIATQTHGTQKIGLAMLPGTLEDRNSNSSWYSYNRDLPNRLKLNEVHNGDTYTQYDYLVWPMHLVQRGFALPDRWSENVIYRVTGGNTTYCYVLAHLETP